MKVILRMHESSEPFVFEDIQNAYTKGPMYCMRLEDGDTLKFPLVNIFSARERKAYIGQEKKVEEKS